MYVTFSVMKPPLVLEKPKIDEVLNIHERS